MPTVARENCSRHSATGAKPGRSNTSRGRRTLREVPQQRTTIEILAPENTVLEPVSPLRIRPVIVDSSFLVSDILASLAIGRKSTFLAAIEFGVLRPFAAHHVWAEMGRNIIDVPPRHGFDAELAEQIWWELYVPHLRFVDTGLLPVPTASTDILGRDSSDAPTIALAALLSPVVVLATDRDLLDGGVATQNYKAVVNHAGTLTVVSQGTWASLLGFSLVVGLIGQTARRVTKILSHPAGQLAGIALAAALLFTSDRWYPRTRDRGSEFWRSAAAVMTEQALPFLADLSASYELAVGEFTAASYESGVTTLAVSVARALASSPHPITRTELAKLLLPAGTEAQRRRVVHDLLPVLRSNNAFNERARARWDLGRAGVDFGGREPSPVQLLSPALPLLPSRAIVETPTNLT